VLANDLPTDLRSREDHFGPGHFQALEPGDDVDFQVAKSRTIERFERAMLTSALREHNGNVSRAARALGLHRQNVQQKLRRLGISAADFRRE
jgi:transcriptional regulator with GAF, ATPase, and Fis domain